MNMAQEKSTPWSEYPEYQPFREAAEAGRLLLKRCQSCGEVHFYPRVRCPFCLSERTEWIESTGRGSIYTFTIVRKATTPTAPAVIELEEGVRLTSVVLDADVQALAIGDPVVCQFRRGPEGPELAFTTPAAQHAREYGRKATADAAQLPGLAARPVPDGASVAIIGAGTMGVGIAIAMLDAGPAVTLVEREAAALERGLGRVRSEFAGRVQRGRLNSAEADERLARLAGSVDMADIAGADIVVEAVWEQLELKREVFAAIDRHARPGALLGTNTSTLDIDAIAAATGRPQDVIGLHFFTPAHVMKLVEVVRGRQTSDDAIARAFGLAQRLGKAPVLVASAPGFVGNRMFRRREAEARRLLLEGATPAQVDAVLREFGFAMGSFELADLTSGVELDVRRRQGSGEQDWLVDRMFEAGRVGQKAGKGYYRYEEGGRKPLPDAEVIALLEEGSRAAGIARRRVADEEIRQRLLLAMVNEGAALLDEGVAASPGDIDAVWLNGYGWPSYRGGPMYYADELGAAALHAQLLALAAAHGERFAPAALLARLAAQGQRFQDLPRSGGRAAGLRPAP
jgi:3-hydroxyacyl-CoA dehydrogenase